MKKTKKRWPSIRVPPGWWRRLFDFCNKKWKHDHNTPLDIYEFTRISRRAFSTAKKRKQFTEATFITLAGNVGCDSTDELRRVLSGGLRSSPTETSLDDAARAWSETTLLQRRDRLAKYYSGRVPLFRYPFLDEAKGRMPLYVREGWDKLTHSSLKLSPVDDKPIEPTASESEFLSVFHEVRQRLKMKPIFNGKIFRLVQMETAGNHLGLSFSKGTFFPCAACQYSLEHELNLSISNPAKHSRLPLRDEFARTPEAIETFCQKKSVRIGISNLLLLRISDDEYKPFIQRRKAQSMVTEEFFDCVTSGFFDYRTLPDRDLNLRQKVFTEVGEELFGQEELAQSYHGQNAQEDECEEWRTRLSDMIDHHKTAEFHVTGFCIDLIPMVPEIVTVFVVRDATFHERFKKSFGPGQTLPEYEHFDHHVRIKRTLKAKGLEEFLRTKMLRQPDDANGGKGFDPSLWTMPGGFCFFQGLTRVVSEGLL